MVGRTEEKRMLQSLVKEDEPQFVAVFGRRRIGKTYLVNESFGYKFTFRHTGISNNSIENSSRKRAQLDKFAESLADAGYTVKGRLESWNDAFNALKEVIKRSRAKKKIIFIDELSWMDTKDSGLISALESFWNGFVMSRSRKDIVLIVCASATYWMIDNILNSKGGLHNRLTGQIHLKPFTLKECEEYLKSRGLAFDRYQILQCYMIMGGIPYYWSLLKKGKSLARNIDALFFKENASLRDEYRNLYAALFDSPEQYMRIVEALSRANMGITRDEISSKTGISPSGDLTKKLSELENCGFIRKYIPYGYKQRGCLYQLTDNYTLFYYKFLKDKRPDESFWKNSINSPGIFAWCSVAFERVCMEHIAQIKEALGISGVHTEINAWKCAASPDEGILGSQIDLLIVRDDRIINLCEMKYSTDEYVPDASFNKSLKRKIADFIKVTKTKYAIHATLITTYGVCENTHSDGIQAVITSDELFT